MTFLKTVITATTAVILMGSPVVLAGQTIDANNPNVTNAAVDEDRKRELQAVMNTCKDLQTSIVKNATEKHFEPATQQCAEYENEYTGSTLPASN